MKAPLKVISELGVSTDSYISAIQTLMQQDADKSEYEKRIQEIIGLAEPPKCFSWFFARALFMYVVQETIRGYSNGLIPDMEFVYEDSWVKAQTYVDNNPWNETRFNIEHGLKADAGAEIEVTDESSVAPVTLIKKGGKKDVTEKLFRDLKTTGASRQKIIDAFIQQVGMSKAGATTYFHTLKKELGFSEKNNPTEEAPKNESKQELAERLYNESEDKSKPTMIALLTEKLGTSRLGAQTYYYACKKKHEHATSNSNTTT
ncbi:MAG: hypothetical protein KGI25_10415 [Thaumarchaeota archaeon]|nr:hypothetical protein [Nitrososphaerota archaeon]